jgi:hypothetical protein
MANGAIGWGTLKIHSIGSVRWETQEHSQEWLCHEMQDWAVW